MVSLTVLSMADLGFPREGGADTDTPDILVRFSRPFLLLGSSTDYVCWFIGVSLLITLGDT